MQIEYHNGTRLLCVIGDPIGHSLSPLLHNTMLDDIISSTVRLICNRHTDHTTTTHQLISI